MKKTALYIAFILFSIGLNAQHEPKKMSADKPSTHGMLIFGSDAVYASHLPMFHSPHDYQVLLELSLSATDRQKYIEDKKQHPNVPTYTIAPERFVLPDMLNHPKPFKVSLYRGHFERGGIAILNDITVSIKEVLYFKKFNPNAPREVVANYILFGDEKEQFLAHKISNKPDFEQIIQVNSDLKMLPKNKKYAILTLDNDSNAPIGVSGNVLTIDNLTIQFLEQLYLEFNDLKK